MRKILRLRLAIVMTLLIALTSATFPLTLSALVQVNSGAQLNYENTMPKEEDIFGGVFSRQNLNLVPYQPQEVSFSICPTMDVPNTVIRFIVPADLVKLVKGNHVWTGDVKNGETVSLELSIEASGEVDANVRVDVEASPSGQNYRSSYYLHVATLNVEFAGGEKGGELRSVSPEAEIAAASDPESPRVILNSESSLVLSNPQSPGTFRIKGRLLYVNENGGYSPGRYMKVQIWDYDTTSKDDLLKSGWTDSNGYFDITAPNDDGWFAGTADPYVRFIAEGRWDWITKTSGGSTYWWRYPNSGTIEDNIHDNVIKDIGTRVPTSSNEALQAGDACYEEAQWIYDWVNWARPTKVDIRWPKESWPHSHGDSIHLPSKSTASWNHVTVHHEYAHSVMWTLYGNSWPPGWEGGSHWVYMEDVLTDAWVEGWAEFMQCAVDNNSNNLQGVGMNIETNTWFNVQDSGDMDGAYIEGSVASILWDILDPTSTADNDHLYWGFNEIFTVVRYDNPSNMLQFWTDWITRWSSLATSKGPLSTIYWHYGINKDFYAPWGSISIKAGALYTTSTSVTLTLSASDYGSGVASMRFSNVIPYVWSSWYTYATSKSWTLSTGDGTKTVYAQFKDNKGYTSSVSSDTIVLDTVKPVTTITHYPGSSTVSLSATDATSGVDKTYYRIDGGTWITYTAPFTLTGTGTHKIDYYSKDKAGNVETIKSLTVHYLTVNTDPAGITTISGTGWYAELLVAKTGTAPATVSYGGKEYTFSTWKIDGTAATGNPISVVMDAPHTATATYTEVVAKATITINTDTTTYRAGATMTVSLGLKNPGADLPVRLVVALMFPDGSILVTLDVTLTLPAGLDTTLTLYAFTLPSLPAGNYYWIAVLMDPATGTWINWDYAAWAFVAPAPMLAAIPSLPVKIP